MTARRHQLRTLTAAGWQQVLGRHWDAPASDCLGLWARRDLPLVVTRQPSGLPPGRLALGLPAPTRFDRRRLSIEVDRHETLAHAGFPALADIGGLLPAAVRADWLALAAALDRVGCRPRVYGSHGWQALTGLVWLHAASDLDLLLPVVDAAMADAVCAALTHAGPSLPRLDGELLFADDAAIAWREWPARHSQPPRGLLVKRTRGVGIEARPC